MARINWRQRIQNALENLNLKPMVNNFWLEAMARILEKLSLGGGGSGTTDHAALTNLGYNQAGHTGFTPETHMTNAAAHPGIFAPNAHLTDTGAHPGLFATAAQGTLAQSALQPAHNTDANAHSALFAATVKLAGNNVFTGLNTFNGPVSFTVGATFDGITLNYGQSLSVGSGRGAILSLGSDMIIEGTPNLRFYKNTVEFFLVPGPPTSGKYHLIADNGAMSWELDDGPSPIKGDYFAMDSESGELLVDTLSGELLVIKEDQ